MPKYSNFKMFSNVLVSMWIFLMIFSLLHSASASLERVVELTEASKASDETKNSLEVEKKTISASHPQIQQENSNLEMSQPLINGPNKNANSNKLNREEKQSTELKNRNTSKVARHPPTSQQTPSLHETNPIGDPNLSNLHHNSLPSYGTQTADPRSLLVQPILIPDVNYVGPVVVPTVYDLFEYGYRQSYVPLAQIIPSTEHKISGLENFGQSKGTGVYHGHFEKDETPYIPPDQLKPSKAESRLLYQQISSEKFVPSHGENIPKFRIYKPSLKEKSEPSSNNQVSESSKEIDSNLENEKPTQYLKVENNIYDNTHSMEKKKFDFMLEKSNKQPEPKGLKAISISKENKSTNQFSIHDSNSSLADDSRENIKGNIKKIDSGLKDAIFYDDYPIQIGSIKIPASRWRPQNSAESRFHAAKPAFHEIFDSSSKNIPMDSIPIPSEKEKNKSLSENKIGETSKKTNIDEDKKKSNQTPPVPKKLNYNTHAKKNKKFDDVDEKLDEQPKNQGLKTTLTTKENKSENLSVTQFNTHDMHSVPIGDSDQNLKRENNKINTELKDARFYGDYSIQGGLSKIPTSHRRHQNKAESQFHAVQPAQSNKFHSRMPSALQKEKILALTKNQVGDSSNETDIDKDKEKLNELLPAKKNENYNTHLEEKNKVKDMDEELNEQPKNQVLKSASISKNKKKKKEFVNQPNTHDSHSAFVDAAIQGLKGKNKTIFSQNKEDMIGEDSLNQKTESPELSNKKDNFLPLQSNKKNIRANYFSNRSLLHNQNFKEKQLIQKFDDNESNILKVKETLINTADDFKDVNEIYTEKAPVDSSKLSTKYNSSKSKSPLNTDLSIPLSVLYEDNSKNSEILETSEKLKETFSKSQFNLKDSELGKKADQGKANGSNAL
ncbi:expressed protein [Phakopsora pachyrhizi]|uniref:Expressed protein n=1 Tax=Phakopsora pachyrhizi TaxID=170000 RepID=A0AAV0AQW6_PHAPC|nr:expressed protein [Phakopsora pachyrhizi]